jgi:hypothetical protein
MALEVFSLGKGLSYNVPPWGGMFKLIIGFFADVTK